MVNLVINVIQWVALLFFSALAIAYRLGHPDGSTGMALDGTSKVLHYAFSGDAPAHSNALSVILPHNLNWMMLQATIAILLLVGFESITSLGEEAKNPTKDIPRGVLLSITIQCLFMYLIEYFAANYFMNSAYSLADAKGSAAPIGDMMVIIGNTAAREFISVAIDGHRVNPKLHGVLAEQIPHVGRLQNIEAFQQEGYALVRAYLEAHRDDVKAGRKVHQWPQGKYTSLRSGGMASGRGSARGNSCA